MRTFLISCFCLWGSPLNAQHSIDLTLEAPIGKGTIWIALYGSEADFDNDENAVQTAKITVDQVGAYTTKLENLPSGKYVLALYQDVNDNGKLDTNLFGVPKEPYAFSRNPKVKWRAPRYEEVVFDLSRSQEMKLVLKKWSKQ